MNGPTVEMVSVEIWMAYPYSSSGVGRCLRRMSVDDFARQSDRSSAFHKLAGENGKVSTQTIWCEERKCSEKGSVKSETTLVNPRKLGGRGDGGAFYNMGEWVEATAGLNKVCVEMKTDWSFELPGDSHLETVNGVRVRRVIDCRFLSDINTLLKTDYLPSYRDDFSQTLVEVWLIFGAGSTGPGPCSVPERGKLYEGKLFRVNEVSFSDNEEDENGLSSWSSLDSSRPSLLSTFAPLKILPKGTLLVIAAPQLDQNVLDWCQLAVKLEHPLHDRVLFSGVTTKRAHPQVPLTEKETNDNPSTVGPGSEIAKEPSRRIDIRKKAIKFIETFHADTKLRFLILRGDNGCGKTTILNHFINLHPASIALDFVEIISQYVGGEQAYLNNLFKQAQALQPCALLIDDFDCLWTGSLHQEDPFRDAREMLWLLCRRNHNADLTIICTVHSNFQSRRHLPYDIPSYTTDLTPVANLNAP